MKKKITTLIPIAALTFTMVFPALSHAATGMREGLWEITSQMEFPGMPMKTPNSVIKHCYSKEDVKDRKNVISADKNCTVTDMKTTGNKMNWTMKCTGENSGTITGETTFGNDSYTTVMHTNLKGYSMTTTMKAKRLGDCK